MMLVGLTGRRGSGKNTAAQFIEEWAGRRGLAVVSKGFADKLKHSAALALGFDVAERDAVVLMDELKLMGEITTCIPNQSVLYTIDGRKFLQLYGTEAHRDVFGEDFWVDALLPLNEPGGQDFYWQDSFPNADIAVVTDVRFENEAQRIKDLGGQIWEIRRPSLDVFDEHSSELGIDNSLLDLVIYNLVEDDLEAFRGEVGYALETIHGRTR